MVYEITDGDGQNAFVNEADDMAIICNGDLVKLVAVKVNGEVLDESNYSLKSGSTIVTLKKDYLNSLQPGTYTLSLEYNDGGKADATFTIKDRGSQSINNPKTGDGMTTFVVMLGLSVIGFAATKKYLKNM